MFNSFLDGTKSAIEMAAVANATGLTPAPHGLAFPPCGVDDLPRVLRPRDEGGMLHHAGQVEVISSLERDGRPVFRDLRWGVYVRFARSATARLRAALLPRVRLLDGPHRPLLGDVQAVSLIGLELGISVASAGLRGEATGAPTGLARRRRRDREARSRGRRNARWRRRLHRLRQAHAGRRFAGLRRTAAGTRARREAVKHAVAKGVTVKWSDVAAIDNEAANFRREMERAFALEPASSGARRASAA